LPPPLRERIRFYRYNGYWPGLRKPRSFNEKLLWRKLYDRDPRYVQLGDKLGLRDYVTKRLGEGYLPALYLATDDAQDLRAAALPERFVMKAANASGLVRFVPRFSESERADLVRTAADWLAATYGAVKSEWFYAEMPRRVVVEEWLDRGDGSVPDDVKIFVYHGRVHFIEVDTGRFTGHRRDLFRRDGTPIDGELKYPRAGQARLLPTIEDAVGAAEILAQPFDFVRVDTYVVSSRIVIGEMTFVPESGNGRFRPRSLDFEFGMPWQLDLEK